MARLDHFRDVSRRRRATVPVQWITLALSLGTAAAIAHAFSRAQPTLHPRLAGSPAPEGHSALITHGTCGRRDATAFRPPPADRP